MNLVAALLEKWTAWFLVSLINHQLHSPSPNDHLGRRHLFFAVFSMLNWFKEWTFLHYDETKDLVYCYTCLLCFKEKLLRSANADPAFVSSLNYVNNLVWITRKTELFILLHVHSDKTDKLDLKSILSDLSRILCTDKTFFKILIYYIHVYIYIHNIFFHYLSSIHSQ